MRRRSIALYVWLFTVFIFALPILTSYSFVQQEERGSINVPLIQEVQYVKAELQAGVKQSVILQSPAVDLSISESPFITLYSLDKKIIGSSEQLNGHTLSLPTGVLDNARASGEIRVTWQPTHELRFASVTDYVSGFGYVTVAQSLREVERRAQRNLWIALLALALGTLTSGLGVTFFGRLTGKRLI